jgi:hypothetical protein
MALLSQPAQAGFAICSREFIRQARSDHQLTTK